MWNYYGEHMWGWGVLGPFMMIVVWAAIILFIVWLVREARGTARGERDKSALEVLKERYAKGEIERKEFEEKKKDLES